VFELERKQMKAFSHSGMAIALINNGKVVACGALDEKGYRPDNIAGLVSLDCAESALEFLETPSWRYGIESVCERGDVFLVERLSRAKKKDLGAKEYEFPGDAKYYLKQHKKLASKKSSLSL
jgi:hypothetical protein